MEPNPQKAAFFLELRRRYPDKSDDELVKMTESHFSMMQTLKQPDQSMARDALSYVKPKAPVTEASIISEQVSKQLPAQSIRALKPHEDLQFLAAKTDPSYVPGLRSAEEAASRFVAKPISEAIQAATEPKQFAKEAVDMTFGMAQGFAMLPQQTIGDVVDLTANLTGIANEGDKLSKDVLLRKAGNTALTLASFAGPGMVSAARSASMMNRAMAEGALATGKYGAKALVADKIKEGFVLGAGLAVPQAAMMSETPAQFGDNLFNFAIAMAPLGAVIDGAFAINDFPKMAATLQTARDMALVADAAKAAKARARVDEVGAVTFESPIQFARAQKPATKLSTGQTLTDELSYRVESILEDDPTYPRAAAGELALRDLLDVMDTEKGWTKADRKIVLQELIDRGVYVPISEEAYKNASVSKGRKESAFPLINGQRYSFEGWQFDMESGGLLKATTPEDAGYVLTRLGDGRVEVSAGGSKIAMFENEELANEFIRNSASLDIPDLFNAVRGAVEGKAGQGIDPSFGVKMGRLYTSPPPATVAKETLQNALDAVRVKTDWEPGVEPEVIYATMKVDEITSLPVTLRERMEKGDPLFAPIKDALEDAMESGDRAVLTTQLYSLPVFYIKDNGIGMSRDVLENAYLDIAGSGPEKRGGELGGAWGFAKAQIFGGAFFFETTTTTREGGKLVSHRVSGTPEQWRNRDLDVVTLEKPIQDHTGTTVKLVFDASHEAWDPYTAQNFMNQSAEASTYAIKTSRVPSEYGFGVFDGQRRTDYTLFTRKADPLEPWPAADLDAPEWTAKAYASKDKQKTGNITVKVLNRGQYQFQYYTQVIEGEYPRVIAVDISSKVPPEHPQYPFTPSRENVKGTVAEAIKKVINESQWHVAAAGAEKLLKNLVTGKNIKGTPHRIIQGEIPIPDDIITDLSSSSDLGRLTLASESYLQELATIFTGLEELVKGGGDEYGFKSKGAKAFGDYEFGGVTLEGSALAYNLNPTIIKSTLDRQQIPYDPANIPDHNIIAINPVAIFNELTAKNVKRGVGPFVTGKELVAATRGTLVHELAHQIASGHDEFFAGVLTRMIGVFIEDQVSLRSLQWRAIEAQMDQGWTGLIHSRKWQKIIQGIEDAHAAEAKKLGLFSSHLSGEHSVGSDAVGKQIDEVIGRLSSGGTPRTGTGTGNVRAGAKSSQGNAQSSGPNAGSTIGGSGGGGRKAVANQPIEPWQGPWKPESPNKWQKAIATIPRLLSWISVRKGIFDSADHAYGTKLGPNVWQRPQQAVLASRNAVHQWLNKYNKSIIPIAHKLSAEQLVKVGEWLEAFDVQDLATQFVKNRGLPPTQAVQAASLMKQYWNIDIDPAKIQLTDIEVQFAKKIVDTNGDVQTAYRVMEELQRFDNVQSQARAKLEEEIKMGLKTDPDVARADFELQRKKAYQDLSDSHKSEDFEAGTIFYDIVTNWRIEQNSLLAVALLADRVANPAKAVNRKDFAAIHKMDANQVALGSAIEDYYKQLAGVFGIEEYRQLGFYMSHQKVFQPQRSYRQQGIDKTKTFVNKLTRVGRMHAYDDNPINNLIRYTKHGFEDQFGVYKELVKAKRSLAREVKQIKDPAIAKQMYEEGSAYIAELYGRPAEDAQAAGATFKELALNFDHLKGVDERTWAKLTNTITSGVNAAYLGGRVGLVVRDLVQAWKTFYIRFGKDEGFINALTYIVSHPDEMKRLKDIGVVPTMGPNPFMSGTEAELGQALGAAKTVQKGVEKASSFGLYASQQERIFEWIHATVYTERLGFATKVLNDLHTKKLTKEKAYDKLKLWSYGKGFQTEFDRLVSAGDFGVAAEKLAFNTSAEHGVIYGNANNPSAWHTTPGRLAAQFNTWPSWQRNLYINLLSNAPSRREALSLAKRMTMTEAGTKLAGAATGLNLSSWMMYNSIWPQLGPLAVMYEDWQDPTTEEDFDSVAEWADQSMKFIKFYNDIRQMQKLNEQRFNPVTASLRGFGFAVDRTEKSMLDDMFDYSPKLMKKKGFVPSVMKTLNRNQ